MGDILKDINDELQKMYDTLDEIDKSESVIEASKFDTFLKNITALDTSSVDTKKTETNMTGEVDEELPYPGSIPFYNYVNTPMKDEQNSDTVVNKQ